MGNGAGQYTLGLYWPAPLPLGLDIDDTQSLTPTGELQQQILEMRHLYRHVAISEQQHKSKGINGIVLRSAAGGRCTYRESPAQHLPSMIRARALRA